jgi:hypothetical protein
MPGRLLVAAVLPFVALCRGTLAHGRPRGPGGAPRGHPEGGPLVRQCFEDTLGRYRGPRPVTLKFTLAGDGPVGRFQGGEVVEPPLQAPMLQACLVDSLLDVRFPPLAGGGRVTAAYPFRFEPAPEAGR